ncbi:hypothetical protein ACS0TY_002800 [Phlomoides rotata]
MAKNLELPITHSMAPDKWSWSPHPSRCGDSFCFGKVIVIYRDTTYRIGEDFSGG